MKFSMTHRFFDFPPEIFSEEDAPDWLTGVKTVKGSTMDCRWFWEDHVKKLQINESIDTDFRRITRIE